jgi:hypothetical protein
MAATANAEPILRSSRAHDARILDYPPGFLLQRDPYEVDAELVLHLVDQYFDQVNTMSYYIFPRRAFVDWVRTCRSKSVDDMMLMHSLLMVGSNFSTRPDRRSVARDFERIARYAIDSRRDSWSIQLLQSRLMLALHCLMKNSFSEAWDLCGAAIRVAIGLQLHVADSHQVQAAETEAIPYGLNRRGFAECKRTTFWAAYLMDVCLISWLSPTRFGHLPLLP